MARTARLAVEIDSRGAKRGGSEADRELRNLKRQARETTDELKRMGGGFERAGASARAGAGGVGSLRKETDGMAGSFLRARVGADGITGSLVALRNAAGVLIGLSIGNYFLGVTDRAKRMDGQLRLAASGLASFNVNQAAVRRIADETRSGLETTAELYGKFARNAQDTGRTQEEAATATSSFAKALKISNASTADAAQITRQFGQALASGVLRGDEFNSIMEGGPRVARLLAESLGKTTGELRAMAEEGELTADKLYVALTDRKYTAALDEEMKLVPKTWDEAVQKVKDSSMLAFAAFDRGGGISNMLIDFVTGATGGFEEMEKSAEDFGMTTSNVLAGLVGAWVPFYDFGMDVIRGLKTAMESLSGTKIEFGTLSSRDSIASLLSVPDQLTGWMASGINAIPNIGGGPRAQARGSTFGQDFITRYDANAAQALADKKKRDEANAKDDQVRTDAQRYEARKRADAAAAAAREKSNPKGSTTRTNAQIAADFERELEARGQGVVGRSRTASRQNDLFKQGLTPLDGYNRLSRHQNSQALDLDKRKFDEGAVRQAAIAAGVKGLEIVTESGGRKHVEWSGGGKKGDASDMLKDQEQREAKLEQMRKRRAEMEADFWATLKGQADTAGMLPDEAERYNAQTKLRAAINEGNLGTEIALTSEQLKQIDAEMQRRKNGEFERTVREQKLDQEEQLRALQSETYVLSRSTADSEQDNLRVMTAGLRVKEEALAKGKSLTDATVVAAVSEAEARERSIAAQEKLNNEIRNGNALTKELLDQANPGATRQRKLQEDISSVGRSGYSVAEKNVAINQLVDDFVQEMEDKKREFFSDMSSKIDQVTDGLRDGLGEAFGTAVGSAMQIAAIMMEIQAGQGAQAGARSSGGIARALSGASSLALDIGSQLGAANTPLGRTLGKIGGYLGQASGGAAIGAQIAPLVKALGFKKFSTTGSQIGGALGSFLPIPGGEIIGSVVGGTIGGLLKKSKSGKTTITSADGDLSASGNSGKMKKASLEAGGGVQEGLQSIAQQLGATLGSFNVTIGQRDGDWRVNTSGTSLKKKKGAKDFNDDADAAIAYAIADAIKDGALKGLSPTIEKIMRAAGTDLEKGLSDALRVNNVLREFARNKDPLAAAVADLNLEFQGIVDIMRKAGATAEEFGMAESVYQERRRQLIEEGNNQALKQMRQYLFELQGGTSSVLSPENRLATSRGELDRLDAMRASGQKVDFGDYQSVADAFLAASRESQGSSLGFFSDLQRVTETLASWIGAESGANGAGLPTVDFAPVVTAVDNQTSVLSSYLADIAAAVSSGASTPSQPVNLGQQFAKNIFGGVGVNNQQYVSYF